MDYTIEYKVVRHEWEELVIQAEDVLANPEIFSDDPEDYEEGGLLEGYPTLIFEKGSIHVDEMWGIKDGNVGFSSFESGVSTVCEGEIIQHCDGREKNLGKFLRLEIIKTDKLIERIEKLQKEKMVGNE